jgi:hypothetical protein
VKDGADDQNRTGDLVLTKDALCQLSYIGPPTQLAGFADSLLRRAGSGHRFCNAIRWRDTSRPAVARALDCSRGRRLERETGIEPATNSLEGCDSTTELLPPSCTHSAPHYGEAGPPSCTHFAPHYGEAGPSSFTHFGPPSRLAPFARSGEAACNARALFLTLKTSRRPLSLPTVARARFFGERRWVAREGLEPSKPLGRQIYSLLRLTASLPRQESVFWNPCVRRVLCCLLLSVFLAYRFEFDCASRPRFGAGEGIRTPDLLITNQLLYRPELRQPKQKWNYSTSCATGTIPTVSTVGGSSAGKWPRWVGVYERLRWRTTSKSAIPAATDTFRL